MFSDTFKKYGGNILLGLVAGAIIVLVAWLLTKLFFASQNVIGASLPIIAIGGMMILIMLLASMAIIFSILGLANKDQAMGLPEGSIRAVIALSLIVLFAILSVFLYKGVVEGKRNMVVQLSEVDRTQFIKDHPALPDIQSVVSTDQDGKPILARDDKGEPLKNPDGTSKYLYDVTYSGTTNAASQDFAKQLLVLLGTLMTAVSSFYLGAGTATSAAGASQAAGPATPTVSSVTPTTHSIASGRLRLRLSGANLNIITNARLVRSGVNPIVASTVQSNANSVSCEFDVSSATPGIWQLIVDDGGSASVSPKDAITLTQ